MIVKNQGFCDSRAAATTCLGQHRNITDYAHASLVSPAENAKGSVMELFHVALVFDMLMSVTTRNHLERESQPQYPIP